MIATEKPGIIYKTRNTGSNMTMKRTEEKMQIASKEMQSVKIQIVDHH
jgi:hypothetical protein